MTCFRHYFPGCILLLQVLKILYEAPISFVEFDMLVKEKTKDFREIKQALHLFEHSVTN